MLVKLFSDTNLFSTINFRPGLNFIVGKYSHDKDAQGINGIGKSTTIRLVNYCMLSGKAEKNFDKKKYDFLRDEDHTVSLEFVSRESEYCITRSFADSKKILFGKINGRQEEYSRQELQKILEGVFFPTEGNSVFFEGKRFGTLMEFFVKDDLESMKRFDPLNFVSFNFKARDKFIFNSYLLNLPTKSLIRFDELSKKYESDKKIINTLSKSVENETGRSVEEFRTEKLKLESEIVAIESSLKEYNFFKSHEQLEEKLTLLIKEINEKSQEYHNANRKLDKIKKSYSNTSQFDISKVERLYNETLNHFGDFVTQKLQDVIEFKKGLLENRNKYLLKEEKRLQEVIDSALNNLSILEKRRSELFSKFKERGALDKVEDTFESLVLKKSELDRNSALINKIDETNILIEEANIKLERLKSDALNDLRENVAKINNLRLLFDEILEQAIYLGERHENSFFNLEQKSSSKKTSLPYDIKVEIPKADALGQARLKLVAYDLMVFLNSRRSDRNIPDFLIHDGVFHGISHLTIINVINFMFKEYANDRNFQYILTFNEDEVDFENDSPYGRLSFHFSNHVIAEFSDQKEKTIFKRFF